MIYAAIDGGGTASRLVVRDNGRTVFTSSGGSTSIYSVGREKAVENVLALLSSFPGRIESLCLGSAGLGRERERAFFRGKLQETYPHTKLYVTDDSETLLVGGTGSLVGTAVIAGTGSICMARLDSSTLRRKGGWGWRLGDEGSAWYIARRGVTQALRAYEHRGVPTVLAERMCSFFNYSNPNDAIYDWNSSDSTKERLASFAVEVYRVAKEGDMVAAAILRSAADELADLVSSMLYENEILLSHRILLSGSVLEKNEIVREHLLKALREDWGELDIVTGGGKAIEGGLMIASSLK